MTFEDAWNALANKNKKINNPDAEITFKAGNLKKLLKQIYDQGFKASQDMHEAARAFKEAGKSREGPMDMFDQMFDGGFGRR